MEGRQQRQRRAEDDGDAVQQQEVEDVCGGRQGQALCKQRLEPSEEEHLRRDARLLQATAESSRPHKHSKKRTNADAQTGKRVHDMGGWTTTEAAMLLSRPPAGWLGLQRQV